LTPAELLALKQSMMHAKVADAWEVFNDTRNATARGISYSIGALARMTPSEAIGVNLELTLNDKQGVRSVVALVHPRSRPTISRRFYLECEGFDEEEIDKILSQEREALAVYESGVTWTWRASYRWHTRWKKGDPESDRPFGYARSPAEAVAACDRFLEAAGWALIHAPLPTL